MAVPSQEETIVRQVISEKGVEMWIVWIDRKIQSPYNFSPSTEYRVSSTVNE